MVRIHQKLLSKLKLETVWHAENVGAEEEWNKFIRDKIHEREQIAWRTKCLMRPKLRTYVKLKTQLRTEPYLEVYHQGGIPELAKIRGGTNRLRIEQGRYVKEEVEERVCMFCESKEVEDEEHFMLTCARYEDLRKVLWQKIETMMACRKNDMTKDEKLNVLIGEKFPPAEEQSKASSVTQNYRLMIKEVFKFITSAMQRRRRLQENDEGVKSVRADTVHRASVSSSGAPA